MAEKLREKIVLERIKEARQKKADELDLTGLGISALPKEIGQLTHLTHIFLSNNLITSFPDEFFHLENLVELNISHNKLTFLPSEIKRLNKLFWLDASHNQLSDLPSEVGEISELSFIDLGSNQLVFLPDAIGNFGELTHLDLSDNQLIELPVTIGKMINLRNFMLRGNRLTLLPSEIGKLNLLVSLDLFGNELTSLPAEIGNLTSLQSLNVGFNRLSNIPSEIGLLTLLNDFTISNRDKHWIVIHPLGNKLENIPREFLNLKSLVLLDLRDNLLSAPFELLEKTDESKVILNYFAQILKEQRKAINESKILVVGQGSVGKTSLIKQITANIFDIGEIKTEGIAINRWQVESQTKTESQQPQIQLNIWDFGGQEIMHATHQFFLTKRSLYLLVLDSRLTQEENRVEYWLKIIQSFSSESPVLIVGNKIDQHPLDIDRTGLQKKYTNIVGIIETSAATGAGIAELKVAIAEKVNNLSHVRDLLPETWFNVKKQLEEQREKTNFINHDDYVKLCAENEVSDETSQRTLIGFLHDLGVVLNFQDDPRLEALGILNPQWVTNGVYKILNSHTLFQNKGVLTVSLLDEILDLPEYPRGKRLFIVDMMKKFELCYDIEPDKIFLVPDLLPKDDPTLNFKGIRAFEYAYSVLPSSIMTRFIVRMNQHIDDGFVWRTGVVLKMGENTALVKADIEDRKITIAIDGLEHTRRDALSAIRYQLDEIHNSIKGLDPEKRVPIREAPNAEPLGYEYLLMLERDGHETYHVKDRNRLVTVNVRQVLSAIEGETQLKEKAASVVNNYYGDVRTDGGDFTGHDKTISAGDQGVIVGKNIDGNLIIGDENKVIQDSYNKIASADIQPELKETLKQLTEAVAAMTKALPEDQSVDVTEDLGRLVDEATKPKPNKKWYSVSIDGLIKAAENLDKLGEPVINLSRKVLSILTGGVLK